MGLTSQPHRILYEEQNEEAREAINNPLPVGPEKKIDRLSQDLVKEEATLGGLKQHREMYLERTCKID